jgi:hypothetical protein
MIIVRLLGGLGNQLFQYTIGRTLSLKKNVPLFVETSAYDHYDPRGYKLFHYKVKATIATENEVKKISNIYESNKLYARLYRGVEKKLLPKYKWLYYQEDEYYKYEPQLMKTSVPVMLEGFWQNYKYYEFIYPEILEELTLKDEYKADYNTGLFSEIKQNSGSISIHIRRGDYVSVPGNLNWFGVMPICYYNKAIEYINSKIQSPVYYIFSDDLNWAKSNLNIKGSTVFVDLGEGKDYLELDAMSKCRHNIIANSSFSWWAAFLNKNPDKIVIAPAQWLAGKEVNKHVEIQFPGWIKM